MKHTHLKNIRTWFSNAYHWLHMNTVNKRLTQMTSSLLVGANFSEIHTNKCPWNFRKKTTLATLYFMASSFSWYFFLNICRSSLFNIVSNWVLLKEKSHFEILGGIGNSPTSKYLAMLLNISWMEATLSVMQCFTSL